MDQRATTLPRAKRRGAAAKTASAAKLASFSLTLLVRHPKADLAKLTSDLGLEPYVTWRNGDQITTPTGRKIPGTHQHSVWSYVWEIERNVSICQAIRRVSPMMAKGARVFEMAQREGGSAELVIRMSGLEHLGASLGVDILQQLAELNLGLGLEVFEHGVGNRTRKSDSGRGLLEALVTA